MGATTYGPDNIDETRETVAAAINSIPGPDDQQYGTKEEYLLAIAGTTLCREIAEGTTLSREELQSTIDAIEDVYRNELETPRTGMEAEDEFLRSIDEQLNGEGVRFYDD